MNNEEKILNVLEQMQGEISGIKGEISGINSRLDGMDGRVDGINSRLDGIDSRLDRMEREMVTHTELRTIIESEINPKFELLAEGHQTLLETLAPKSRVEELEEDVKLLKAAINFHSAEIAELKKAN